MKLSEAILLGSIGTEQGRGNLLDHNGRTCAMGAAYIAAGFKLKPTRYDGGEENYIFNANSVANAINLWPYLTKKVMHPILEYSNTLVRVIEDLNDCDRWTRPQIAAWVATVEPKDEPVQGQGQECVPNLLNKN